MYSFLLILLFGCSNSSVNFETEAIKKAENELVKFYGNRVLMYRPFSAKLDQTGWTVTGSKICNRDKICGPPQWP